MDICKPNDRKLAAWKVPMYSKPKRDLTLANISNEPRTPEAFFRSQSNKSCLPSTRPRRFSLQGSFSRTTITLKPSWLSKSAVNFWIGFLNRLLWSFFDQCGITPSEIKVIANPAYDGWFIAAEWSPSHEELNHSYSVDFSPFPHPHLSLASQSERDKTAWKNWIL